MKSNTTTAGAAIILEYFTRHISTQERNTSKRMLAEVVSTWPGEPRDLWWRWIEEASQSLGLRSKTFDCTFDEAVSLANDHGSFVCYRASEDETTDAGDWFAVVGRVKRRFEVLHPSRTNSPIAISSKDLKRKLDQFLVDDQLRCVILQPAEIATSPDVSTAGHSLTPLQRLWQLLKPEAADIRLVLIFTFVVALLMLAPPIAVEALVNTVAFGRFLQPIIVLSIILLTFLGFQAAVRALQTYVVEIIQRRLFARVAGDLAYRLPRTEIEALDGEYPPELVNRFFDIVTVQKVATKLLLDGVGVVLGTLVGMVVLGFYHPWLLGFDLLLLCTIAVIIFVLGRGAIPSAVKESKHKYYMAGWLEDIARCPTAFRNDGGAEFALERADHLIHGYLTARRKHFRIVMRQIIFALSLQAVASTVLLGLGGWLVVSGELTLGQLVAAELIVTIIVGSFAKFGKYMESFYDLLASVDKLGVLFDLPTVRQDGVLNIEEEQPTTVELHSLSYSWTGQPAIIKGLSTSIHAGESVAVLGESGSGKSTLVDLLAGLRDPTSGHLTIDGFDPRDLRPDCLSGRVALVREAEVFHATIEENVHLHREGVTATHVRDALNELGLLESVLRLENGVNTVLTSHGTPLSANQCRLLSIARATIGHPGLLIVDGTLDALGDQDLDRCLDGLLSPDRSWTLIVTTSRKDIAVRLSRTLTLGQASLANTTELVETNSR